MTQREAVAIVKNYFPNAKCSRVKFLGKYKFAILSKNYMVSKPSDTFDSAWIDAAKYMLTISQSIIDNL